QPTILIHYSIHISQHHKVRSGFSPFVFLFSPCTFLSSSVLGHSSPSEEEQAEPKWPANKAEDDDDVLNILTIDAWKDYNSMNMSLIQSKIVLLGGSSPYPFPTRDEESDTDD